MITFSAPVLIKARAIPRPSPLPPQVLMAILFVRENRDCYFNDMIPVFVDNFWVNSVHDSDAEGRPPSSGRLSEGTSHAAESALTVVRWLILQTTGRSEVARHDRCLISCLKKSETAMSNCFR